MTPTPLPTHIPITPSPQVAYVELDSNYSDHLIQYLNQKDSTSFWFFSAIICLLLLQIYITATDHRKQD